MERVIKNGQSRETGNIGYTRPRKTKQKHNTICDGHYYMQTNTKNVYKTWVLLQTTVGKDKPESGNRNGYTIQNAKTHNRTAQKTQKHLF